MQMIEFHADLANLTDYASLHSRVSAMPSVSIRMVARALASALCEICEIRVRQNH